MSLFRCSKVSGGGSNVASGNTVKINGVEVTETSAASQQFEIDTGLSSINTFVIIGKVKTVARTVMLLFDKNIDNASYSSVENYSSGSLGGIQPIGTATNQYAIKLDSIIDGRVVMTTPSSTDQYGTINNIHWYAE